MILFGGKLLNGMTIEEWAACLEFERLADYSRAVVVFSCVECKGEVITKGGGHISHVPAGCTHFEVDHKYAPYLKNTRDKKPERLGGVRF